MNKIGRKFLICTLAVILALLFADIRAAAQQPTDTILHNGKILTVDKNFAVAQAIAIRGNLVAASGTNQDILAMRGPNTQVLDLKGRTVVPGLVDTHRHIYGAAESYGTTLTPHQRRRYPLDWRAVRSKQDILDQIKGSLSKYDFEPGQWIYFTGNPQTKDNAGILYDELNQTDLGSVTPDNPILLGLGIPDFNGFLANAKAMDTIFSQHGDFIRKYGRYWIDKAGKPDGHLEPPASRLFLPFTYDRPPELLGPLYKMEHEELHSMGVTTVGTRLPKDATEGYRWLQQRGELKLRLGRGVIEAFGNVTDLQNGMKGLKELMASGDDWLWVTGIGPTAVDGQNSRACTDLKRSGEWTQLDDWFPVGQCHTDTEYKGAPARAANISGNYFRDWLFASGREGIRFANVHVSGDRAVGQLLTIFEQVQQQYGKDAIKDWGLDHCVLVNPKDFERAARLGIFMSCFPGRSINGENEGVERAYGSQIAQTWTSPMKSMIDKGVKVVFESDTNVYEWVDIEIMVNRKDENGKVWGPQEKLDRPTALRTITQWAADYMLRGNKLGSLTTGKLADLVVLDKDYLTIPDDQISEIAPQLTMVDGKIVFLHTNFANEYNLRPAGATVSTYQELIKRRGTRCDGCGG